MAFLPLLLALILCTIVVLLLPDAFRIKQGRRRLPSCLTSINDRICQRWALSIAVLGALVLIVTALMWWYISVFGCCATMQTCAGGADEWESEPWVLTAFNAVAIEKTATWQNGGSVLRVEYCTGALADWFTPDCSDAGAEGASCLGDWTCWTECSADCGGGLETRTLEDASQSSTDCVATQSRPCNTHECAVCGDELGLCVLDRDARPDSENRDGWALVCCCWGPLAAAFVGILPLLLALLWLLCNRPREPVDDGGTQEEQPLWIVFLLDPNGVRHAVEVRSSEFVISTILEKASAATGIPEIGRAHV